MRGFFWNSFRSRRIFVWLETPETVLSGQSYGVELAWDFTVSKQWSLHAAYTYLHLQVQQTATVTATQSADPNNQFSLRSSWNLGHNVDFDITGRYVDELLIGSTGGPTDPVVPAYLEMDMRLAWRPRPNWEVALVGQNLLHQYHYEFLGGTDAFPFYATEVPQRLCNADVAALMLDTSAPLPKRGPVFLRGRPLSNDWGHGFDPLRRAIPQAGSGRFETPGGGANGLADRTPPVVVRGVGGNCPPGRCASLVGAASRGRGDQPRIRHQSRLSLPVRPLRRMAGRLVRREQLSLGDRSARRGSLWRHPGRDRAHETD